MSELSSNHSIDKPEKAVLDTEPVPDGLDNRKKGFEKIPIAVYGLALIGLVLRITFALNTQNVDHPDETFQYLEPAHRLVFGYGFIPWEFRFGARSWLVPFIIALPLTICKVINAAHPSTYIPAVKIMLSCLSTSLIFTTYTICRNIKSERAGLFAAALCTFWYELIYFSSRPLSDAIATYFLIAALAFLLVRNKQGCYILFGLCAAIGAPLRFQYLPLLTFIHFLSWRYWSKSNFMKGITVSASTLLLGGIFDLVTVGSLFGSTVNNIDFNVNYKVGELFRAPLSPLWYLEALLATSCGFLTILFVVSCRQCKSLWPLICFVVIAVLSHSVVPSKYYRYIFVAIPILLSLAAIVLDGALTAATNPKFQRWLCPLFFTIAVLLSFAGYENWLPNERLVYRPVPLSAPDPAMMSFAFLSREKDMAGLYMDQQLLWTSGGYYTLHHPVPIYNRGSDFSNCEEADPYISHMVCHPDDLCPELHEYAHLADLIIGKHLKTPYKTLPDWDYNLWQSGIDDKFKPSHHQFLAK